MADAIVEPVPLDIRPISQRGCDFSLMSTDDGWRRFNNHVHGIAPSFDFRVDHGDEAAMVASHASLMRGPGSPFTNALAVLPHTAERYVACRMIACASNAQPRWRTPHLQRGPSRGHV